MFLPTKTEAKYISHLGRLFENSWFMFCIKNNNRSRVEQRLKKTYHDQSSTEQINAGVPPETPTKTRSLYH